MSSSISPTISPPSPFDKPQGIASVYWCVTSPIWTEADHHKMTISGMHQPTDIGSFGVKGKWTIVFHPDRDCLDDDTLQTKHKTIDKLTARFDSYVEQAVVHLAGNDLVPNTSMISTNWTQEQAAGKRSELKEWLHEWLDTQGVTNILTEEVIEETFLDALKVTKSATANKFGTVVRSKDPTNRHAAYISNSYSGAWQTPEALDTLQICRDVISRSDLSPFSQEFRQFKDTLPVAVELISEESYKAFWWLEKGDMTLSEAFPDQLEQLDAE